MLVSRLLRDWHKEADQEENDAEQDKSQSPLGSSPESAQDGLVSLVGGNLVILFVVEVGKRHDQQTENRVQAVEGVVDDLQYEKCLIHAIWRRPILLRAQFARSCGADEGDIHGEQQDGRQQGEQSQPADERHGKVAFAGLLVDEDEKGRDEEEEAQADGIRDPDERCFDQRHGGRWRCGCRR